MSQEHNVQIAEWIGWKWIESPEWRGEKSVRLVSPESLPLMLQVHSGYWRECDPDNLVITGPVPYREVPHYSTDLNPMALAEAVVKERGKGTQYAEALFSVCGFSHRDWYEVDTAMVMTVATATAPQRAEAMCRMIDGETT